MHRPSCPLPGVQYKNDIAAFFRETHPDATAEFGFSAEVMDTYIKSLAGYSVITYLLAIVSPRAAGATVQRETAPRPCLQTTG